MSDNKRRHLLFLDDEPNILKALRRAFFAEDYDIETFESPSEALEYLRNNKVELIIADQRMPEMTGTQFLVKAKELDPAAIRIVLTGYADIEAAVEAINHGEVYKFLFKPWNDQFLRVTVRRALEHYDLQRMNEELLADLVKRNAELEEANRNLNKKVRERTTVIVQRNIELGKLNRALEQSLLSTVRISLNLIEQVYPDLGAHSRRTALFAVRFAERLELNEHVTRDIEAAALLHDAGKLGIPRAILDKSGEIRSGRERDMVRNHPIIGQNLFADVEEFQQVGRIIRCHHEQWDGGGYPDGLKGSNIPFGARVLALCNRYDHLQSGHGRHSAVFVRKFFEGNAGTLFDPELVGRFLQFLESREREVEPARKVRLLPHELKAGMILADNLSTESGIFLLPKGQKLRESHIVTIREMNRVDPIDGGIEVILPATLETE